MAALQKALITTYFGLPKEVHEDADVTKNRCDKQSDEIRGETASPSHSSYCSPPEGFTTTGSELQRSRIRARAKQVVNLFGGLLGHDVRGKRAGSTEEGRVVDISSEISGSGEMQDRNYSSPKDGHSAELSSRVIHSGCQGLSTTKHASAALHSAGALARSPQEGLPSGAHASIRKPLTDTQACLSSGEGRPASCTVACGGIPGTSYTQSMLAFDKKGKLVAGSSLPSQQQTSILETTRNMFDSWEGHSGGQTTVDIRQEGMEEVIKDKGEAKTGEEEVIKDKGEVVEPAKPKRRKKAKTGEEEENTAVAMDLSKKERLVVSNESLLVSKKSLQLSRGRDEKRKLRKKGKDLQIGDGGGKEGGVSSKRRSAAMHRNQCSTDNGMNLVEDCVNVEDSVEKVDGEEEDRCGDEAVEERKGRRRQVKRGRKVCREQLFENEEDFGELKTIESEHNCASNRSDKLLSRVARRALRRDQDVDDGQDISSRSKLSRRKKQCSKGTERIESVLHHEGWAECIAEEKEGEGRSPGVAVKVDAVESCDVEVGICSSDVEVGICSSDVEVGICSRLKRTKNRGIQLPDVEKDPKVEDRICKRIVNEVQVTDKPKMMRKRKRHLDDDLSPKNLPHNSKSRPTLHVRDRRGCKRDSKRCQKGSDVDVLEVASSGDEVAPSGDEVAPSGDEVAPSGDEVAPSGDEVAPSGDKVASSGDECEGPYTNMLTPVVKERPASKATPLCSSWADIFKKPLLHSQKEVGSIDTPPKGVNTPLNQAWSGIFKKPMISPNRRGDVGRGDIGRGDVGRGDVGTEKPRGNTGNPILVSPSPVHQGPAASPAACWITSPNQDSPSNFSPSPLRPPQVTKSMTSTTMDYLPFTSVVHVRQQSPDEPFWNLQVPSPTLPVKLSHCSSCVQLSPSCYFPRTVVEPSTLIAPTLKLCDVTEQEHLLAEMEQCSPTTDIRAIYRHYTRYSKLAGRKNSVQVLSVEDRGCGGELVVAIKVLSSLLPLRIMVDGSAYGEPRRKSLRLSKSHHARSKCGGENENERPVEITGVMVPPPPPPPPTPPGTEGCDPSNSPISSELWSECYQPVRASEVLSNTAQVQQLYQWMVRWEERATAQRGSLVASGDMASTKPACSKQAADRTRGNSDGDSDGDFVATTHRRAARAASSDSDSVADASNLCPVALLCGPHGSGKTAAVLACAEELGFKVFVVDSTTVRSRQNILTVLREATLSHQVTKQQSTGGSASEQCSVQPVAAAVSTKPSRAAANNLLSFFKPRDTSVAASCGSRTKKGKCKEEDGGGNRKGGGDRKGSRSKDKHSSATKDKLPPPQSSEVALVVATVIVLEEVDILFEDEKGFWAAIYEIIATTKRPVVMTSNADICLDCDHIKITFSPPSPEELAPHIQALCLAHRTVIPHNEAKQIAIYLGCDTRKVLNTLQYWLSPGRQGKSGDCTGAKYGYAGSSIPVGIDHLLGLSYQQASLLKHALCSSSTQDTLPHGAAAILSEALLLVNGGQLAVRTCLNGDTQCSSDHCHRETDLEEVGVASRLSHYVSFPWRGSLHKRHRRHPRPASCLDLLAGFLDTLSEVDFLDIGGPWKPCERADLTKPWWEAAGSSRAGSLQSTYFERAVNSGITATVKGLALAAMTGQSHCTSCDHDYYGLLQSPAQERHYKAVHTGQMLCCEVFDAQTELSRSALAVDCLPVLHRLCQSENRRERESKQRRFRHYLQSSTVDTVHLKSFAKTATLHSAPDGTTNTLTLP